MKLFFALNEPIIDTEEVRITRKGAVILDGLTFSMTSDQHLAIIGPNGAGKSFLLSVLSADLIPSSGRVTILGKTFGKCNMWDIRRAVGFVSSRMVHWIDGKSKVMDVVGSGFFGAYGVPEPLTMDQEQAVLGALDIFDMREFKDRTYVTLSDGERRKVLLCRAMVTKPKFLILDEPCQGLDIRSRDVFLEDLDSLGKKVPLVYVTHHLEELPSTISDVMFLKGGRVFARGKKETMLTSAYLSELFDYQVEVVEKGGRYYMQHV